MCLNAVHIQPMAWIAVSDTYSIECVNILLFSEI